MKIILRVLWLFTLFLGLNAIAQADDFDKIKEQISLRQVDIANYKSTGVATEGGDGLLIASPNGDAQAQATIAAENTDRSALFDIIAGRTGKSRDEVVAKFVEMASRVSPLANPSSVTPTPSDQAPTPGPVTTSNPTNPGAISRKVISRPFAKIYTDPDATSDVKEESVPAFTIYYVVASQEGWYSVSEKENGAPLGWIRVEDVAEWKHNLVVEYSHPDGRSPVLMFKKKEVLKGLVTMDEAQRLRQVNALYNAIIDNKRPDGFPVVAMEPKQAVDTTKQFYILPITDFESGYDKHFDFKKADGRDSGRRPLLLKIAAMTKVRSTRPLPHNPIQQILMQSPEAAHLKVDIVFVMDLTKSMGPFADRTVNMMREIVKKLKGEEGVKFGFWGYRDDPVRCQGIGFLTKNYTPGLLSASSFLPVLATVKETEVDSVDYEEDALSGVHDAVDQTQWRPDSLRFLIMVGDAPGREPNQLDPNPYGETWANPPVGTARGEDENSIRALADSKKIYLAPIYLTTPRWAKYAPLAEKQWYVLGQNRNLESSNNSTLRVIPGGETGEYGKFVDSFTDTLVSRFDEALHGNLNLQDQPLAPGSDTPANNTDGAVAVANNMFRGAFVDWLGNHPAPPSSTSDNAPAMDNLPSDISAWVVDKDLNDPSVNSLEVKVFLTKGQLDSLKQSVDQILNAFDRQKINSEDFFTALQAVAAYSEARPDQMQTPDTLAKSGYVPAFILELPYHSEILTLTADDWKAMQSQDQDRLRNHLDSKLKFYRDFYDNTENWQPLHPGDSPDAWVGAVPLAQMP